MYIRMKLLLSAFLLLCSLISFSQIIETKATRRDESGDFSAVFRQSAVTFPDSTKVTAANNENVDHIKSTAVAANIEQTYFGSRPSATLVTSFDGLGAGFEGPQGTAAVRNPSDNSLA